MNQLHHKAPRIGMGCWAIGGPFWNQGLQIGYSGANDQDSFGAIHASWAAGIRIFDTSAVYGAGHSETLLGQALAQRSEAIIVSKLGHSFNAATKQMTGPRFDPAYVRDSVAQSRARLKRDRIDVMLLHLNDLAIDDAQPVFDTLEELREAGQIGSYGWSTDFPDRIKHVAESYPECSTVQHAMNVCLDAPAMSNAADKLNLTRLIRSPLAMGILTGKFDDTHRIPHGDVRRDTPDLQGNFDEGRPSAIRAEQLDAVRDILTCQGRTLAQGALCWLLAKSPNILPIPGAKNAAQAEENAAALDFGPLEDAAMQEIELAIDRSKNVTAGSL
ncbi:MAG: aldo/keto reductase [Rhizobiaceae bacterium]